MPPTQGVTIPYQIAEPQGQARHSKRSLYFHSSHRRPFPAQDRVQHRGQLTLAVRDDVHGPPRDEAIRPHEHAPGVPDAAARIPLPVDVLPREPEPDGVRAQRDPRARGDGAGRLEPRLAAAAREQAEGAAAREVVRRREAVAVAAAARGRVEAGVREAAARVGGHEDVDEGVEARGRGGAGAGLVGEVDGRGGGGGGGGGDGGRRRFPGGVVELVRAQAEAAALAAFGLEGVVELAPRGVALGSRGLEGREPARGAGWVWAGDAEGVPYAEVLADGCCVWGGGLLVGWMVSGGGFLVGCFLR